MMERQPIRVLIADDHPIARLGLRSLLATWPMVEVVGEAVNGQEAVWAVGECRPDVALMDVRMPVLDGLQATRLIKSKWPAVRVIVLTVNSQCRTEALAASADAFLIKGRPTNETLRAILGEEAPSQTPVPSTGRAVRTSVD